MTKKQRDEWYLRSSPTPLFNPYWEFIDDHTLRDLIYQAYEKNLTPSDGVIITRVRYGKKQDGAGQPELEEVQKVVSFRTLRRWYKFSFGENITKKTFES